MQLQREIGEPRPASNIILHSATAHDPTASLASPSHRLRRHGDGTIGTKADLAQLVIPVAIFVIVWVLTVLSLFSAKRAVRRLQETHLQLRAALGKTQHAMDKEAV